jgi:hypothetical protein
MQTENVGLFTLPPIDKLAAHLVAFRFRCIALSSRAAAPPLRNDYAVVAGTTVLLARWYQAERLKV